jgi:hypothetical protein
MQICMNAYHDVSKKPCIISHGFKSFCQGPVCTVENGYIVRLGSGNYSHAEKSDDQEMHRDVRFGV